MTGIKKPTPLEAFELNMEDADRLVDLAEAFTNARARRMRVELRTKIGAALGMSAKERDLLDCAESEDVFVVLKPGGRLNRKNFDQHDPLLRQSIVAGCAAVETFLADRIIAKTRALIGGPGPLPKRLAEIGLTVDQLLTIESEYTYRKRGLVERVIAPQIREMSSTAPSKVGHLLSAVGLVKPLEKLDAAAGVPKGSTEACLDRITKRRNSIAHEGDRVGYRRRAITVDEVREDLASLRSVVAALDKVIG